MKAGFEIVFWSLPDLTVFDVKPNMVGFALDLFCVSLFPLV